MTELPREEGWGLHARLFAEDPTAPRDVAFAYLDSLTDWLIARNKRVHPNDCSTAAEDAILGLIEHPDRYDPERQTLEVYLRVSASGDLKNILRSEHRHGGSRVDLDPERLGSRGEDPAAIWERRAEEEEKEAKLRSLTPASVQASLTKQEEKALRLMQVGERKTAAYAVALEITHLPFKEQQKEVKLVKDRLQKRLERSENHGD